MPCGAFVGVEVAIPVLVFFLRLLLLNLNTLGVNDYHLLSPKNISLIQNGFHRLHIVQYRLLLLVLFLMLVTIRDHFSGRTDYY